VPFTMLGIVCLLQLMMLTPASKIMVIGDSYAEGSGTALQDNCAGSTVVNKGASGTTAENWNSNSADCGEGANCQFSTAFSGSGWTHAWLSLGANDIWDSGCSISKAQLKSRLESSILAIKAIVPGISIVLTGYPIMAVEAPCTIATFLAVVHGAMEEIAAADGAVTFWDMAELCGGTISPESQGDAQYFVEDGIHMDDNGYQKLWTNSALQLAFGCSGLSSPSPSPSPSHDNDDADGDDDSASALTDGNAGSAELNMQYGACMLLAIMLHQLA